MTGWIGRARLNEKESTVGKYMWIIGAWLEKREWPSCWRLDTQSRGYLSKQYQKAQREDSEREASKGALKSHLLHVLECQSLTFCAFYSYVTHTLSPPTPTAWHATLITNVFQAFISSSWEKLHLFFFSIKMTGKTKKRWQIRRQKSHFQLL